MIRIGTLAVATVLIGLAGSANAQMSTGTYDSIGANPSGSKSGVPGKADGMDTMPETTGTAVAPGTRMAPADRRMTTDDPSAAPRTINPAPGAR